MVMAQPQATPQDLVYTPVEVARYTLDEVSRRRTEKYPGVPMGLVDVDKTMNPLRPGQLVIILGRPGHYKSGLAQWWARHIADSIKVAGAVDVVVYTTLEMAIEELGIYDLAVQARLDAASVSRGEVDDEQMTELQAASGRRACLPLWLLGHSLARRKKRIKVTIHTIESALFWIEDNYKDDAGNGFKARVVFLDYLNLIRPDEIAGDQRRNEIESIVRCAKDMALFLGCPVVMLAQARRECEDREWKLPVMRDAYESAAIEQYADKILSVWMPHVTNDNKVALPEGGYIDNTKNLLLVGLVKQKDGPAGGYFKLYVDPARNEIAPMAREDSRGR
jgi:replicative DNA helicase